MAFWYAFYLSMHFFGYGLASLGHEATLTTTLDQSSDSTKVVFTLVGVPLGKEEEIKRNIEGY